MSADMTRLRELEAPLGATSSTELPYDVWKWIVEATQQLSNLQQDVKALQRTLDARTEATV
jgi:hypothetical protein